VIKKFQKEFHGLKFFIFQPFNQTNEKCRLESKLFSYESRNLKKDVFLIPMNPKKEKKGQNLLEIKTL